FRKLLGSNFFGVKVDVEQHRELVQKFEVQSIPMSILISPEGKELKRKTGLMTLEPFVTWIRPTRTGSLMWGTGVDSDAGLTGAIVLDEKKLQTDAIDPPTDEEVLKALEKQLGADVDRRKIRIVKEKVKDSTGPAKFYPMVGPARMRDVQFKCTVYYEKDRKSDWPIPFRHVSQEQAVIYVDHDHLMRVKSPAKPAPPKDAMKSSEFLPSAAYLRDDVQYFPGLPKPKSPSLADLVEKYKPLFDTKRYAAAREVGLQAVRSYPNDDVAKQMLFQALTALKDKEFLELYSKSDWHKDVFNRRAKNVAKTIEQKLDQPVSLKFENVPLSDVAKQIATQSGLNVVVDSMGLNEEGVRSDHPVTLNVENIKLSSALKLLLRPLNLDHVIEDEVLKITGKTRIETRDIVVVTYPVADLVVPMEKTIKIDLRGKTSTAKPEQNTPNKENASSDKKSPYRTHGGVLGSAEGETRNRAFDFEELIELIQSTVEPDSWDEKGGFGSIRSYETTLSLVIRHNKKTHEKIQSILAQLRRLQDVQVTLEINTIASENQIAPDLLKKLHAGQTEVMDPKQAAALKAKVTKNDPSAGWRGPKITLFNGQVADLLLPASTKDVDLRLMAVSTEDRRFVRLSLERDSSDPKQEKHVSLKSLRDGHSLLVEINRGKPGRKFVLITPRIIV
ncbi:MAG: hypothetical protein KDA84_21890, partial [Planctomycetaceae bacterium]|nr:hypothetical protein [Planctomycetaceae bacterium]